MCDNCAFSKEVVDMDVTGTFSVHMMSLVAIAIVSHTSCLGLFTQVARA